jgi:hypothetical protein
LSASSETLFHPPQTPRSGTWRSRTAAAPGRLAMARGLWRAGSAGARGCDERSPRARGVGERAGSVARGLRERRAMIRGSQRARGAVMSGVLERARFAGARGLWAPGRWWLRGLRVPETVGTESGLPRAWHRLPCPQLSPRRRLWPRVPRSVQAQAGARSWPWAGTQASTFLGAATLRAPRFY